MSEGPPKLSYGARVVLDRGDAIRPRDGFVYFIPNLDAATWAPSWLPARNQGESTWWHQASFLSLSCSPSPSFARSHR